MKEGRIGALGLVEGSPLREPQSVCVRENRGNREARMTKATLCYIVSDAGHRSQDANPSCGSKTFSEKSSQVTAQGTKPGT
jgi:hypothetical protein